MNGGEVEKGEVGRNREGVDETVSMIYELRKPPVARVMGIPAFAMLHSLTNETAPAHLASIYRTEGLSKWRKLAR